MADSAGDEAPREVDVIVVGSGPGGATLGYLLARSGVDVLLAERERNLARTFRGFLFQPFVLRIFDQMDILDEVLDLEHQRVQTLTVDVYGRTLTPFDFGVYDPPYDHALLMEQPPLLRLLINRADEYGGFEYWDGISIKNLIREGGRVVGVHATDRDAGEDVAVRARVVVGADGRYSTVRTAAGIDPRLLTSMIELVWFKLPADAVGADALGRLNDAGVLLYFGLGGGEAQLGYFVEKGEYPTLRTAGIETFHERIAAVDPSLRGIIDDHVTDFDDCSLLHIEPGVSESWVDDGLLLLGDAAHVASPVGGQGNGLAIADAVVAHATIMDALTRTPGPLPAQQLSHYEQVRRPTVARILRLQRRGEWALSAFVRQRNRIPEPVRRPLLQGFLRVILRSPLSARFRDRFAWGSQERVNVSRFINNDAA